MRFYAGYGLCIQSALSLPELIPASPGVPDVTIRTGETGHPRPETDASGSFFAMTPEDALLYWDSVGAFRVRDGREVIVEALPGVEERRLRLPLLGMVMGTVLQQRGLLVLHGSAVAIQGKVAALVGYSGAGKSTLAAAIHARGHPLVADDLVAVEAGGGRREARCQPAASPLPGGYSEGPRVFPTFPQLKLRPDAARASLGDDPAELPPLAEGITKRARSATERFSLQPLPLGGIYLLHAGEVIGLSRLSQGDALVELIRHSYAIRVFQRALTGPGAAEHLRQCTAVATSVPVSRLTRDHRLEALSEIARQVEAEFCGDTPASLPREPLSFVPAQLQEKRVCA